MAVFHGGEAGATDGGPAAPKLLDQVRARMRRLGMARRSEEAYVGWIRRFILANDKRHPAHMGAAEIERFLTTLAVHGQVSASTQNQALEAILFLYRHVLRVEPPWLANITRATRFRHVPVVLTREETRRVLAELRDVPWLVASLLYGSGLRLSGAGPYAARWTEIRRRRQVSCASCAASR